MRVGWECLFLAIEIVNNFFSSLQTHDLPFNKEELHLLGITSIFTASKLDCNGSLQVGTLMRKLGSEEYEKEQILRMEREILMFTIFKLPNKSLYTDAL